MYLSACAEINLYSPICRGKRIGTVGSAGRACSDVFCIGLAVSWWFFMMVINGGKWLRELACCLDLISSSSVKSIVLALLLATRLCRTWMEPFDPTTRCAIAPGVYTGGKGDHQKSLIVVVAQSRFMSVCSAVPIWWKVLTVLTIVVAGVILFNVVAPTVWFIR